MRLAFRYFNWVATNNDGADTSTANQPQTYTQEQVQELLRKETETLKKQNSATIAQLEGLKKAAGLTQKERDELQAQINNLQSLNLSKEEQARQEADRLKRTYEEEKNGLSTERDAWKNRYEDFRMKAEIGQAASELNAFSSKQITDLLLPKAKLVSHKELVNGEEKLSEMTIVTITAYDKAGKPVNLDLPVKDAITKMKELPEEYGNLFRSEAKGGTGLLNGERRATQGTIRPGMTHEEYVAMRAERQKQFGSKIR